MANDKDYIAPIAGTPHCMRIRQTLERGMITAFTVQLEAWIEGEHRPVIRFDSQHGRPHCDILDWDQETVHKDWEWSGASLTRTEAFTMAQHEILEHWQRHLAAFLRRKP